MKHVQTLVCKSRQFGEDIVLPSQPYDQRYIGVCKPSSMMSLPVDITVGAEEYKEEVEKGVSGDERYLADIAEVEPIGYLHVSQSRSIGTTSSR